ncbi:hypothetical protein C0Q70_11929 [Pomacea canaliculata]|uniref:Akirin n=1 Tax=Pomacea canaliculata TaxID=400727 RepID=A0A2T7P7E9_POMCA|nr:hypothetical protein C0Q70_11929 [Pomacea canaliculata]
MQRRRQLIFPSTSASPPPAACSSAVKPDDVPSRSSSPEHSPIMSASFTALLNSVSHNKKDVPLFTFRQVSLLCERMMRERDEEVKEHYDRVLNCKLAGNSI